MIKKFLLPFLCLILLVLGVVFCSGNNNANANNFDGIFKEDKDGLNLKNIQDVPRHLVLIYDGGVHRSVKWDPDHFEPYLVAEQGGKMNWLFDGFLFLEIKDGKGRGFASGYEKLAARKVEWENLLLNYFEKGNAIDALDSQIEYIRNSTTLNNDFEKHKVVLTLPEPIPNQTDWGILDGKHLQFSSKRDRMEACKWYVEYAEKMFSEANFKNVELVGFYWLAEEATNSRGLAYDIARYLYDKEYDFYWIPYFYSDGYDEWQNLGFNMTYYQSNYFFSEDIPYSRLQETYDRASKNKMNLEIEFDDRALKNKGEWGYRLGHYLDAYEENGVFDSLKIAYYQGEDSFYKLSKSNEEEDQALYKRLVDLILKSN